MTTLRCALVFAISTGIVNTCWAESLQNSCGPQSCLIALKYLGIPASFEDVAKKCAWTDGDLTDFQQLRGALEQYPGVSCVGVHISESELERLLANQQMVAILGVRRDSVVINHAICAIGFENGEFICHDGLDAGIRISPAELQKEWTGEALLVAVATEYSALQLVRNIVATVPWSLLGIICFGLAIFWRLGKPASRVNRRNLIGLIVAGMGGLLLGGCVDSNSAAATSQVDWLLGTSSETCLGVIAASGENRSVSVLSVDQAEFVVDSARSSCGCVAIVECPDKLSPNVPGLINLRVNPGSYGPFQQSIVLTRRGSADNHHFMVRGIGAGLWSDQQAVNLGRVGKTQSEVRVPLRLFWVTEKSVEESAAPVIKFQDDRVTATVNQDRPEVTSQHLAGFIREAERYRATSWSVAFGWKGGDGLSGKQSILARIELENDARLSIPIHFEVDGVLATPVLVNFGEVTPPVVVEREIVLQNIPDGQRHDEITATVDCEHLSCVVKWSDDEVRIACRLHVPAAIGNRLLRGNISVFSNGSRLTNVPFVAVVARNQKEI